MNTEHDLAEIAIKKVGKSGEFASPYVGERYDPVAIMLHWVLAATIFGLFGFGVYIANISPSPKRSELIYWHQVVGIAFLILTIVRAAWRFTHRPPKLPRVIALKMPDWQHVAHRAVHMALYVMFFVVPLLGWVYSSAAGLQVMLFDVLPLPNLIEPNEKLAAQLIHLHGPSGLVLILLAFVHIGAALEHHWLKQDGLVSRMLPGRY